MSFQIMGIKKDFIQNGGTTLNLDNNKDGFQEYTLNKTESGSSFEIFDFNSDGKKDLDLYYNKDGEFIDGNVWDENGNIKNAEVEEMLSYIEQAKTLREQAQDTPKFGKPNFKEVKGIYDIQKDHIEISRQLRNLSEADN